MKMLEELKKMDKRGLFDNFGATLYGFRTGFLPFDFYNGYRMYIKDSNGLDTDAWWPNIGLFNGTFITICGNTGVAKTSFTVQSAANMVRNIPNASIIHFDLETSSNISRIQTLTRFTVDELDEKYQLIQNKFYIEDVFEIIKKIAKYKIENKKDFWYVANRVDEFGKPIELYVPTVIIIDSLPLFVTKDVDGEDGMMGLTYAGRVARQITQFYQRLTPVLTEANILVYAINHIKDKIDINPMAKSQADIMYMSQNKTMPGGKAPRFLAQNVFEFIYAGKFTVEKDGFDGFLVRCSSMKSRTNKAGKFCHLVYNQETGFDPWATLLYFIKEHELLGGRNPYSYFIGQDDFKFDSRKFSELCQDHDFRQRVYDITKEPLESLLSNKRDKMKEMMPSDEE